MWSEESPWSVISSGSPPIIPSIARPPVRRNRTTRTAASTRNAMLRKVDVSFTLPKSYSLPPTLADSDITATVEAVYTEAGGRTFGWRSRPRTPPCASSGGPRPAPAAGTGGDRPPSARRRRAGRGGRRGRAKGSGPRSARRRPAKASPRWRGPGPPSVPRGGRDDLLLDGCHFGRCRGRGAGTGNLCAHRPTVRAGGGVAVRPAPHQGPPARPDLPPAVPDRPADPGQHPDRHHVGPGPGWHHPGQRVRDRGRRRLLPGRRPGEGRGQRPEVPLRGVPGGADLAAVGHRAA